MTNNIMKKTATVMASVIVLTMFTGGAASAKTVNSCKINVTEGYACILPSSYGCDSSACQSSDTSVATVSSDGKITAVNPGVCTISIKDSNGINRTCKVTVNPYSMTCSADSVTLNEGASKTVSVTVKNSKSIKAYSTDTSVASISFGKWNKNTVKMTIKGVKAGTAKVKVYFTKDKSVYKIINVNVTDESASTTTKTTTAVTTAPKKQATVTTKQTTAPAKQTIVTTKQTTAATTAPKTITMDDNQSSVSDAVTQVLNLVNEQRTANGLEKLTLDTTICKMADVRADEVSTYFSHTRPDGTSCFTIFDEYNYSYKAVGENIAKGQRSAQEVMDDWMNSPGHKANILSSNYTKIGIGYDSATNSWVQLFAA